MSTVARLRERFEDKWWVVVSVTLGMLMSLMDSTIVNVAIPKLKSVFGVSLQEVQWTVTIYMITQAAVIPTAPYLATRFGSKRAWVWTLVAFLVGSMLCGFAWNLPSLIFFRFLQGIGGGILLPMVMTLLYQAFAPEERGTASSMMSIPLMAAPVLGPIVGGYLVAALSWRWAFFLNLPLGLVAIAIARKALKETPPEPQTRFDLSGFLTVASGSIMLLYSLSALTGGNHSLGMLLLLVVAVGSLLAFVRIEQTKTRDGRQPLLNLARFRDRTFSWSVLTLMLMSFVNFGVLFFIPTYLQTLQHRSAQASGIIQSSQAVAMLFVLPFAGKLSDRKGARQVVRVGLILIILAIFLLRTLTLTTPALRLVGILALMGIGSALAGQVTVSAMSRIRKEELKEVANGSTLLSVLRATAAPMGVALLTSFAQVQSRAFTQSLSAQGISGDFLVQQSTLLASHRSFLVAAILAIGALLAMSFVPSAPARKRVEPTPLFES